MLWSPKRSVRQVGEGLRCELDMGNSSRYFFQKDAHLHTSQVLAHALMPAITERQVVSGIVAIDVQLVRVFEVALVVIGRCGDDQELCVFRDINATNPSVGRSDAPPGDNGACEAKTFLDSIGDQG